MNQDYTEEQLEEIRKQAAFASAIEQHVVALRKLGERFDPASNNNQPGDRAYELEGHLEDIYELLEIRTTECFYCRCQCPEITAHLHDRAWIGNACCWTDQLRNSE